MISPGVITVLAVVLAAVAAGGFGVAAVFQHRAVRRTVGRPELDLRPGAHRLQHRLGLSELISLVRRPVWLAGTGLMLLSAALHITALVLAPVSLIQPIGVLAVPTAVLVAAGLSRRRPARIVALPIALCVAGVGLFVWLSAGQQGSTPTALSSLLLAGSVVAAVIIAVVVLGRRLAGGARCVSSAVAGAFGLGLVSALVRGLADLLAGGVGLIFSPIGLAMVIGIVLAGLTGSWLVQQAYASGPPEVVIACLTVVDPMVAVVFGFVVLGEGESLGLGARLAMIGCGVAAAVGVAALSRSHPEAVHRRTEQAAQRAGQQAGQSVRQPAGQRAPDTPAVSELAGSDPYRWSRGPRAEARSRG